MKNKSLKLIVLLAFVAQWSVANTIKISDKTTLNVSSGATEVIVDDGDITGNYSPNKSYNLTITPDVYDYLLLDIKQFDLGLDDTLYITDYTGSPVSGSPFLGNNIPTKIYNNSWGSSLTLKFVSVGADVSKGFIIEAYSSKYLECANVIAPYISDTKFPSRPTLKWNAVPHATDYLLTITGPNNYSNNTIISDTSYTFKSDLENGNYTYTITSNNSFMSSEECPVFDLCLPLASKPIIAQGDTQKITTDNVILSAVNPPKAYEIGKWYDDSDGGALIQNLSATQIKFYGKPGNTYNVTREHTIKTCTSTSQITLIFEPNATSELALWFKMDAPTPYISEKNQWGGTSTFDTISTTPTLGKDRKGITNTALVLSGDDKLYTTYSPDYWQYTASMWVNFSDTSTTQHLMHLGVYGDVYFDKADNKIHFKTATSSGITEISSKNTTIAANTYYFITVVIDNNYEQKLYINGIKEDSKIIPVAQIQGGMFDVGYTINLGYYEGNTYFANATFDDFRFNTIALPDAEILKLATDVKCAAALPSYTGNTVIYDYNTKVTLRATGGNEYRWYNEFSYLEHVGNEFSFNTMQIKTGNGNYFLTNYDKGCESERVPIKIVFNNDENSLLCVYNFNSDLQNWWTSGNAITIGNPTFVPDLNLNENSALNFQNNYSIELDTNSISNNYTVSFFIKPSSTYTDSATLFSKKGVLDILLVPTGEAIVRNNAKNKTSLITVLTGPVIEKSKWSHIAYTHDSLGNETLYINGVLFLPIKNGFPNITPNYNKIYIGNNGTGENQYKDYYDELYIYHRTLNATQIANLYNKMVPFKASFTATPSGNTINFTSTTVGAVTNYWTFGDGQVSAKPTISNTYLKAGLYEVCLNTSDSKQNASTTCQTITVGNPSCIIQAKIDTTIDKGLGIVYVNGSSSLGSPTNFYWDNGNGETATGASNSFAYDPSPGTYTITLTATNTDKTCMSTAKMNITFGEPACKADFSYSYDAANGSVRFINNSNQNYQNWIIDGNSIDDSYAPTLKLSPGNHTVTLTVTNWDHTCAASITKNIQIEAVKCKADFNYFIDNNSNTANFSNTSQGTFNYTLWSFGDGSASTSINTSKMFAYPGYHNVTLTVSNTANNCVSTVTKNILVNKPDNDIEADFDFYVNDYYKQVFFFNKTKGNITNYIWNLGENNQKSYAKDTTFTYYSGGVYNVCLYALGANGVSNLKCKDVPVSVNEFNNCKARFESFVDNSMTAKMIDVSAGNPNKWNWDLGDNTSYTSQNGVHTYAEAKNYIVSLKVWNNFGCRDLTAQMIRVQNMSSGLNAGFAHEQQPNTTKATGYPVDFVGVGMGDNSRLKWDFGDGETDSTTNTPTHTYASAGTYEVCYTMSDPITEEQNTYCETITLGTSIGVQPVLLSKTNVMNAYPVPFNNLLNVAFKTEGTAKATLTMYDINGRIVANKLLSSSDNIQTLSIDASGFSAGVYHIRLVSGDTSFSKVVIKK